MVRKATLVSRVNDAMKLREIHSLAERLGQLLRQMTANRVENHRQMLRGRDSSEKPSIREDENL